MIHQDSTRLTPTQWEQLDDCYKIVVPKTSECKSLLELLELQLRNMQKRSEKKHNGIVNVEEIKKWVYFSVEFGVDGIFRKIN